MYRTVRAKNLVLSTLMYQFSRRRPQAMKALLRKGQVAALPPGFDVDTHFAPPYDPWDQRLCLIPDGDLFKALSSHKADIVTGRIERFTETGIRLESGVELPADIVVTATGLQVQPLGGMTLTIDGEVDLPTPGHTPIWKTGLSDRANPPGMQILLSFNPPSPDDMVAQVVSINRVHYSVDVSYPRYRYIMIRCGNAALVNIPEVQVQP